MTYDLAVVGGGPGGCATAIVARRAGYKVLLLERGKFPRQKVCGEFVSSEALGLLRELLGESLVIHSAVAITSARIFIDGKTVNASVTPAASSIPRFDMDQALWRAAEEMGVHTHQQTVVQRIEGDGAFEVHTNREIYSARCVVNASGRWSNLSAASKDVTPVPRWIGVKAHFSEDRPAQSVDLYFFSGGYCGVQPVGKSEINVCAMVRSDVASDLLGVFACEPNLLKRSSGWMQVSDPVSTSPLIFREPSPVSGNILLVGDAAGFIDPFVGDGISMALHSGRMAANSLSFFLNGSRGLEEAARTYAAEYKRKLLPAFRNASRARKMISAPRMLRSAALGLMNFPGLAELLVNKTRARIV